MKGTFVRFSRNGDRQAGFLRPDDPRRCGGEVFIHSREIVDRSRLEPGARFEFDVEPSPDGRGPIAVNAASTGRDTARRPEDLGTRRGWVRTFNGQFGFVKPEGGGRSLFFRATPGLLESGAAVAGGLPVEFETGYGPEGRPEAINVRRITPEHEAQGEARSKE